MYIICIYGIHTLYLYHTIKKNTLNNKIMTTLEAQNNGLTFVGEFNSKVVNWGSYRKELLVKMNLDDSITCVAGSNFNYDIYCTCSVDAKKIEYIFSSYVSALKESEENGFKNTPLEFK